MPPYGLYSLANTPEELLNRGYGYSGNIPMNELSDEEENLLYTKFDPAFGNLNTDFGYFPAPYTGSRPFKNASFLRDNSILGFDGDIDNPSFGGSGNPRFNQFEPTGITPQLLANRLQSLPANMGVANEPDVEEDQEYIDQVERSNNPLKSILDFIGQFSPTQIIGRGIGSLNNKLKESSFYRPSTTGVFGFSPDELNKMNALGGYYSEPERERRRRAKRISGMLRRAAKDKSYSNKNLKNLMNQFGMGNVDVKGMIDSMKESAAMGYGEGDVGQEATPDRDYSSSPGAMAGDMEYGEE